MISQEILSIRTRMLQMGWTQVDLVTQMYKSGRYKSRSSLQVQVNYLLTGKRFNKTSEKLLEHVIQILDDVESGKISREVIF